MSNLPKLLIVEDDEAIRTQLKYALRDRYALWFAENRVEALALVEEVGPDVVSLDLGLPPHPETAEEGLRALEDILRAGPTTKVVVLTGSGDRVNARRAIALGAFDYLAQLREIFSMVSLVAKTEVTVLIQGESGTGKELVARAVHGKSLRKNAPFVAINCGAIPETLLESELFGHEKGAYTGAHVQRKGKLELADGGTVFLDEVAEMPTSLQVKLLRFLQERTVERLGGRQSIPVDVRIIAASNKDLKDEIAAGGFREDLYFRLSVVTITLPPLRERAEDIGMLANTFLRRAGQEYRRKLRFSREAIAAVAKYQWPGNIRELENSIQRASIMARGRFIESADLGIPSAGLPEHVSLREARNRVERQVVVDALTRTRGNISRAATELGVSRPTLHSLLDKHGIDSRELRPARAIG